MKLLGAICIALLVLPACGPTQPSDPRLRPRATATGGEQKYRGTGLVLQEKGREPELCLGAVAASLPPQCGGPRVEGWDWDEVSAEESASGVTWGRYAVVGFYDGNTFVVLEVRPPAQPRRGEDEIKSGCPEPSRGWETPDPERASEAHQHRAIRAAEREPDFAGAWIDYIGEPSEFRDNPLVLNLAFTSDIEEHEREIREIWGGALCVTRYDRTLERLLRIQSELTGAVGRDLGLHVLYSSIDVTRNLVEIAVVVIDTATRVEIRQRYGEGTVHVDARLEPLRTS